ncbi:MAG: glucokinase [Deltaproteobacteria bacterium]|nr:glucokinase [Deltaproteobacteria bacterium]
MRKILIGDVGGTKTALAVVSPERGPRDFLFEKTFLSAHFSSLDAIIEEFLKDNDLVIDKAVFGVAGPVVNGQVKTTNLPWFIEEIRLKEVFHFSSARLMNDLEAIACAVLHLEQGELLTLNEGTSVSNGNIAVVAPGTGLGEAFLTWDGERYHVHASEGGHVDFASKNPLETELLIYLNGLFGHVSYERVCSGPGISNIYEYLKQSGYGHEPSWLTERLEGIEDPTPVIVNVALDKELSCELCIRTLDEFVSILGAEAGNLALKVFATQGVYLGGGIPPRILPFLEKEVFMESFRDKGRYSDFMDKIPVHVIIADNVALFGAACRALEQEN